MVGCSCVSHMSALLDTALPVRGKFGTEIPDSHPFATKVPNHAIPLVFSRPSDVISHKEITSTLSCLSPTSPEADKQVPSLLSLILRKWMAKAFPDSQAACAAVSVPGSAGRVGMPLLGEWPSHWSLRQNLLRERRVRSRKIHTDSAAAERHLYISAPWELKRRVFWGWTNLKH